MQCACYSSATLRTDRTANRGCVAAVSRAVLPSSFPLVLLLSRRRLRSFSSHTLLDAHFDIHGSLLLATDPRQGASHLAALFLAGSRLSPRLACISPLAQARVPKRPCPANVHPLSFSRSTSLDPTPSLPSPFPVPLSIPRQSGLAANPSGRPGFRAARVTSLSSERGVGVLEAIPWTDIRYPSLRDVGGRLSDTSGQTCACLP